MNVNLNARAIQLAEQDITLEEGLRNLIGEGKALVTSLGFMAAVDATAEATTIFEQHHCAASERRLRERNPIKGFRLTPKLG